MPGTPTPNLGLVVPTVGGDANIWGTELNNNLAIIDQLAAPTVVNVATNFTLSIAVFPEITYRAIGGVAGINGNLPNPATSLGKIFTIKKVDSGVGAVTVVGAIDGGTSWVLRNQYSYVRVQSNGASYDVIANN